MLYTAFLLFSVTCALSLSALLPTSSLLCALRHTYSAPAAPPDGGVQLGPLLSSRAHRGPLCLLEELGPRAGSHQVAILETHIKGARGSQGLRSAGKWLHGGGLLASPFQGLPVSHHTEAREAILLSTKGVSSYCAAQYVGQVD